MSNFNKILIGREELERYLPQRPPIVMVSSLCGCNGNVTYTTLDITPDNIFCHNGVLSEPGIIEHVAQSIGLRNGYLSLNEGKEVSSGVIGAVTGFKIFELPPVGSTIKSTTVVEHEFMGLMLVSCSVSCNETIIAEGKMKVALIKKEE